MQLVKLSTTKALKEDNFPLISQEMQKLWIPSWVGLLVSNTVTQSIKLKKVLMITYELKDLS